MQTDGRTNGNAPGSSLALREGDEDASNVLVTEFQKWAH